MEAKFNIPSIVEQLNDPLFEAKGVEVFVKRDDLIDPHISGNKWRKLRLNFQAALNQKKDTILTFGGAYSNHIAATAAAAKRFHLNSIGIIRGDELNSNSNKTLAKADSDGMKLIFVKREEYSKRNEKEYLEEIREKYREPYLIPEGGANELGVDGCADIYKELKQEFDFICISAGTGTTAAGILKEIESEKLLVFPALKGAEFLKKHINQLSNIKEKDKLQLILEYHFGGYGKISSELLSYMESFEVKHHFVLDKIYTSKLFYGVEDLIRKGFFPNQSKLLIIHTGGLQGN